MPSVHIRPVERFPEPEFSQLQRSVFADLELASPDCAAALQQAAERRTAASWQATPARTPPFKLGAYRDEQRIVWCVGSLVVLRYHFGTARRAVYRTRAIPCAERTS
ncbi:MAG: hypothetical protein IPJ08_02785 [Burkholderiales bacterium]|nr:hypothetical protein [Burkholderiales bacterium]